MKRAVFCAALLVSLSALSATAAEYNGQDVDGQSYSASAYSYSTSKWYNVTVEFSGDDAEIFFQNGGHITVTLDDEEIEDPHNISTYDYAKSTYWDLDVDGME